MPTPLFLFVACAKKVGLHWWLLIVCVSGSKSRRATAANYSPLPSSNVHAYICTSQQYVSQTLCQTSSNPLSATRALLSLSPLVWFPAPAPALLSAHLSAVQCPGQSVLSIRILEDLTVMGCTVVALQRRDIYFFAGLTWPPKEDLGENWIPDSDNSISCLISLHPTTSAVTSPALLFAKSPINWLYFKNWLLTLFVVLVPSYLTNKCNKNCNFIAERIIKFLRKVCAHSYI